LESEVGDEYCRRVGIGVNMECVSRWLWRSELHAPPQSDHRGCGDRVE
jgi:hypothetical protein